MARKIDPRLAQILAHYDCDPKTDIWDCHGTWVAYHRTVEQIAAKAGIEFSLPHLVENDIEKGVVVLLLEGRMKYRDDGSEVDKERLEWSFGEASPKNNKNSYPYAMAEKRAKDRVALKLVGLHGLVYSEEEADDFKQNDSKPEPEHTAGGITQMNEKTVKGGRSSGKAKADGGTEAFNLMLQIIGEAESKTDLTTFYKENRIAVSRFPANWQNLIWEEFDIRMAEFNGKPENVLSAG